MKKSLIAWFIIWSIVALFITVFKVSWDRYQYLSEEVRTELYVTHKTQSLYYHRYYMSTQNWLVFMDTDGTYRQIEVSIGTYLTVNPPRNVVFYLSRSDMNYIRGVGGFWDFDGGPQIVVVLLFIASLILWIWEPWRTKDK